MNFIKKCEGDIEIEKIVNFFPNNPEKLGNKGLKFFKNIF